MRGMRRIGGVLLTVAALACGCFFYVLLCSPVFPEGESYTFYLGDSSSARAVLSETPLFDRLTLGNVRGESVVYAGERYEELKDRYRAELRFTEKVGNVTNYYLYSPAMKESVVLNGVRVNLHIAVGEEKTVAGTPLIFGGF